MSFEAWVPSPTNIQGNLSCYASYKLPVEVAEITDDWATILANVQNGTYRQVYKIGNYKPLDLGTEGTVNMQIVAFDTDTKASGGMAPITWLSKELLKTSKRWNQGLVQNTHQEVTASGAGWVEDTENGGYKSNNQGRSSTTATATFTLTPSASGTLKLSYKVGSEGKYDKLTVKVDGATVANAISGNLDWADHDVTVTAGTAVSVQVSYQKDGAGDQNGDTAYIKWSGVAVTVSANIQNWEIKQTVTDNYGENTGTLGGWENCELRAYYRDTLMPLIPAAVRSAIVPVSKVHTAYRVKASDATRTESFQQTTTETVWCPSYPEMFSSRSNGGLYHTIFPDNTSRIKQKVDASSASNWWLRSASDGSYASCVRTNGNHTSNYTTSSCALALGFCT